MRLRTLFLLVLALALPLSACDSTDDSSLGGTYVGSATVSGISVAFELTIPNTDSGTFAIRDGVLTYSFGNGTDTATLTGTGTYAPPAITFDLETDDPDVEVEFAAGTVSADGGTITLISDGQTLVLRRQ